MALKVSLTELL